VNHQLHTPALVKETFGNQAITCGNGTEGLNGLPDIGDQLLRSPHIDPAGSDHPFTCLGGVLKPIRDFLAQVGDSLRKFGSARGCLAKPEGNRRRTLSGVLDADFPHFDTSHSPGVVAEKKDIAPGTVDGKIFVDRPYTRFGRLFDDIVVTSVGDRPSSGDGSQSSTSSRAQDLVHAIEMEHRRPATSTRRETFGEHLDGVVEILLVEVAVGRGSGHQIPQGADRNIFVGDGGDNLLRQDIETGFGNLNPIEFALPDRPDGGRGLDHLVPGQGEENSLGDLPEPMPRSTHSLQKGGNRPWSAEMTDEVDVANIDAQLKRGCRYDHGHLTTLQLVFSFEPDFFGKASVVGHDTFGAQSFAESVGDSLDQASCVDEDDGGLVLLDQFGDAIIDRIAHLMAGHRG